MINEILQWAAISFSVVLTLLVARGTSKMFGGIIYLARILKERE